MSSVIMTPRVIREARCSRTYSMNQKKLKAKRRVDFVLQLQIRHAVTLQSSIENLMNRMKAVQEVVQISKLVHVTIEHSRTPAIYRSLQCRLRLFSSSTVYFRLLAEHATKQLPTGILRDSINKLNATLEPLVLSLHIGYILGHQSGQNTLYDILRSLTLHKSALMASASAVLDAARTAAGGCNTMYASGSSPLKSSCTGMTHTSATSG